MMKNKFLTIIAVILAFAAGVELTIILMGDNSKKEIVNNGEENSVIYNSCSNCMSGTTIVENGGISETVKKIYDSAVMIKNYRNSTLTGSGSGFVYKVDDNYGYIMTNQHVVEDATKVTVIMASGEEVDGTLLGGDKYLDIAVVRIPVNKVISVAKIGTSENLQLGETIVAIGTPVGEDYYNTITGGHISGLNRKVTVSVESKSDWVQDVIQIDASINPGNSGGALVNINGEVIGITSMKLVNSSIEGMGFAIKIDDAMKHVDALEKGEKIQRPYLGITHANISDKIILNNYGVNIDESLEYGVVILDVQDGTSASSAGLKVGDVITKVDGEKVLSIAHLRYLLYKHSVGETIKVTYVRGTAEKTIDIELTQNRE